MIASASPLCPPPCRLFVFSSHLLTLESAPLILFPFAFFPSVLLHFTPFFRSILCCTCEIAGGGGGHISSHLVVEAPAHIFQTKEGPRDRGHLSDAFYAPPLRASRCTVDKKVLFVRSEHFGTLHLSVSPPSSPRSRRVAAPCWQT